MVIVAPKRGMITIQHNGENYSGEYRFSKGLLTVKYIDECKNIFLKPESDPEPKARLMIIDLIKKVLGR